ncbi:(2Fe-2S)-binding protein [Nocardioides massiliensis]|uniref:Aerobic-type carbon monoxide dehydrogenase small subunit (CoxS/CutS family) n=1 Tax=Nocardioides massiliensis TaxID=1325935 RepID=A0ABT9NK38_9ACTN|nr:(2Fe-2S)-binding protein [Nocardioides massiliensis]MDP9820780.1 aerobic-type carbon monoxide dehydrogenase small subunit (CoxS/CutS family) [Nocardioides massiliensis]
MADDIQLEVNGVTRMVRVTPNTVLLQVLRNYLGLTGTKFGCGLEQCRACVVLVDGRAVPSCSTAVNAFVDKQIVTVEGLSEGPDLHSVQRAFIAEGAAQCGYCTPGMIIASVALLNEVDQPTEAQIRAALEPHLCRCGSHPRIIRAVQRAARDRAQP